MSDELLDDSTPEEEDYNPEEDESEYTEWTYNEAKHRYEYIPELDEDNEDD